MTSTTIPTKKGPRKKTGFYHAFNEICPNKPRCAEVLGVTVEQVEQWIEEGNDLAEKYLRLWDQKYINLKGWEGFSFSRGLLKYKGRTQWTPDGLKRERSEYFAPRERSMIDLSTEFRDLRK